MPVPDFSPGEVLTAAAMDSIGLWLVKSQTVGAGVSSVTVTGAFSADYDQYLITYNGGSGSTTQAVRLQLGPSSVAGYNANYNNVLLFVLYAATGTTTSVSSNAATFVQVGESDANFNYVNCVITNPNKAAYTHHFSTLAGLNVGGYNAGIQKNTGQYTEFTLSVAGTITGGTIRVYGYRN
jgi:hypothetical protein